MSVPLPLRTLHRSCSRPPNPSLAAYSSLLTHIRRDLGGLKIRGTIPIDVGQMTELTQLCVGSLVLPARCSPSVLAPALCAPRFIRAPRASSFARSPRSPPSHSFRAYIRRLLDGNKISGTVPNAFGQLTKLLTLCVFSSSPRLRVVLALRCSLTALSPLRALLPRAHSQRLDWQQDRGCWRGHLRHQGPHH